MSRNRRLRHRPTRTIPATIAGVILLLVGAAVVIAACYRLVDHRWTQPFVAISAWLAALRWSDPAVWVAAVAAVVLGLVSLIAAVTPGRPNATRIRIGATSANPASAGTAGPVSVEPVTVRSEELVMPRRAVARLAAARAELVSGVDTASAVASTTRVRVRIRTTTRQSADVRTAAAAAVSAAMTEAGMTPEPRLTVTVENGAR